MKNITRLSMISSLLFICFSNMAQTEIRVSFISGNDQSYNISNTGKLYFDNGDLVIKTTTETTLPINTISKIIFKSNTTTSFISGKELLSDIIIYPNPASESVIIKSDKEEKLPISIYTTNGQVIKEGNYSSGESINVASLAQGLYLITVNGKTFKFHKK